MSGPVTFPYRGLFLCLIILAAQTKVFAQQTALTPKTVKAVTDSLCSQVVRYYVDKDAAVRMSAAIRRHQKQGRYQSISDPHELAGRLSADLRRERNDEHLHVDYNPGLAYELSGQVEDIPAMVAGKLNKEKAKNFGFRKIEILSGNIGYLELSGFSRLNQFSRGTARAALQLISNASAIVIDLRYGSGGSPDMMTYILGHFYDKKVHVSDIFIRSENTTISYFTEPDSAFKSLHSVPVFVLTSYKTFSAAEGFAYTIQKTGRGRIIGETTRGGAHTVTYRPLGDGFVCDIPFGVAKSPLTGANWEGKGIEPDIACSSEEALTVTARTILSAAVAASNDSLEARRLKLQMAFLPGAEPVRADSSTLAELAGFYGTYSVTLEKGCLYYQKSGMARFALVPLATDRMRPLGSDEFLVEFSRDEHGKVRGLSTLYLDGREERAARNH